MARLQGCLAISLCQQLLVCDVVCQPHHYCTTSAGHGTGAVCSVGKPSKEACCGVFEFMVVRCC
jgi:hypothetical protein